MNRKLERKSLTCCAAVFALWLGFALGCASSGNKNGNISAAPSKCPPFEIFIKTPNGGNLVEGVTVSRDGNGNLTTKWKSTFPAGTKSMIDVGFWRPNKKKDIPYGPLMDGAGMEKTSSDGTAIINAEPFNNEGQAYNTGQYYVTLNVIDNSIWNQPSATKAALSAARGKLKAIESDSFSVTFEVEARFELPDCSSLAATGPPASPTPFTKQAAEAMARKLLAKVMESKMAKSGHPVTISVSGVDNTTITIESPNFTRETVMAQTTDETYLAPFRKQHYKRVEFTDGLSIWGRDLK